MHCCYVRNSSGSTDLNEEEEEEALKLLQQQLLLKHSRPITKGNVGPTYKI